MDLSQYAHLNKLDPVWFWIFFSFSNVYFRSVAGYEKQPPAVAPVTKSEALCSDVFLLFHVYLKRWNPDWAQFPSLRGKASQQAWYWPHPPGEGAGQCNRVQGTILDHLTIISKCTPAAISARPPWECSSVFYSAPREPCNANSTHHSRGNNGKRRQGGALESSASLGFPVSGGNYR